MLLAEMGSLLVTPSNPSIDDNDAVVQRLACHCSSVKLGSLSP